MKNQLIGALVASLLLFIWQFLSYGPLDLHGSQMSYTANQDAILEALSANNLEEGEYFIPRAPRGSSMEEQEAMQSKYLGKPWATITYHKSLEMKMGMNMFRGWLVDFVAAFLLCWILLKMANLDFKMALMCSLSVGLIGYLTINYLDSIWFEVNSIPDLIDAIVSWGLVGIWLGWWLTRGETS